MKKYKCEWQSSRIALLRLVEANTPEEALRIFHERVKGPFNMELNPSQNEVTEISDEEFGRLSFLPEWRVHELPKDDGDWMGHSIRK